MISITRKLVRTLRAVFKRSGDGTRRQSPPILFDANTDGLWIWCHSERTVVSYHLPAPQPAVRFMISFADLAELEGGRDHPITLNPTGDIVEAHWTDAGVPQHRSFTALDCSELKNPSMPEQMAVLGDDAFPELAEVSRSCGEGQVRYALDCLQLRGQAGEAVGSDALNLLITSGFRWPWTDNLLIPRSKLFSSPDLATAGPVSTGCTEQHVVFQAGRWTLWFAIEKELRYPTFEHVIPDMTQALTRVTFAPDDQRFLEQTISRLPHDSDEHLPVTMHCNGHVAIRGQGADGPVTELVLSQSTVQGEEVLINMNRDYLRRAARLGLSELGLWKDTTPMLCSDARHRFVWQPLSNAQVLRPSPDNISIHSPTATVVRHQPLSPSKNVDTMPETTASKVTPAISEMESVKAAVEDLPPDPIEAAEQLRDLLRDTVGKANRLISALKRQKRQHQFVRSTLASLKQLQDVA